MKILIIDDEKAARVLLENKLNKIDSSLKIVCVDNPLDGIKKIQDSAPDVVFLDIQMPEMDGFEMLEQLNEEQRKFSLVFCTAYSEYGVKAFEEAAIDFLLKPVDIDRLKITLDRLKSSNQKKWELFIENRPEKIFLNRLSVKIRGNIRFISVQDIAFFSSEHHETIIKTIDGKEYISNFSLGVLEQKLDPDQFFRTHRSYITNLNQISEFNFESGKIVFKEIVEHAYISKRKKSAFLNKIKKI